MNRPDDDTSPYEGLFNLLERVIPRVVESYRRQFVEMPCDCWQCRRDVASMALCSLRPIYYGSLDGRVADEPLVRAESFYIQAIDHHVRRAFSLVAERSHHGRGGLPPEVATVTPSEVAERMVERLASAPLMDRLWGIPLPLCVRCNRVGSQPDSRYCDACGEVLILGLPDTSLPLDQGR